MKTMPRILLLLFSFSAISMFFIARCGLNMDIYFQQKGTFDPSTVAQVEKEDDQHRRVEENYQNEVHTLQKKIHSLQLELDDAYQQISELNSQLLNYTAPKPTQASFFNQDVKDGFLFKDAADYEKFFDDKVKEAEIHHGNALKTEYEVISFNRFSNTRIYLVDPGLGKRVIEKPIGHKKKDLIEIATYAMDLLNKNRSAISKKYSPEDFLEGIYRNEPSIGSHYELYFRNIDDKMATSYSKVTVLRPFGPPRLVNSQKLNTNSNWINIILPLSGRVDTFKAFMQRFERICIKQDKRVFLTVVYFGKDGLKQIKDIMSKYAKQNKYKNLKLVTLNEKFARGRGLQVGALNWKGGDVLMFLCDVDVVFSTDFLERCRLNTERGKRVYYPIVFSLYNPKVVYSLQDMVIPAEKEQLIISKDTGFWRDFGYGMTCQYRSDFLNIKGFDEHITGWGGEDVVLYKKYVSSDLMVVRATDPGIFHLWHEKLCDPNLSSEQYRSCIRSKALNEASHAQLGLLAFKDEVNVHRSFKKKTSQ